MKVIKLLIGMELTAVGIFYYLPDHSDLVHFIQ